MGTLRATRVDPYLDPWHIVLLHLFHLLFDGSVQFILEFQRLHVIHEPVVVVKVPVGKEDNLMSFSIKTHRSGEQGTRTVPTMIAISLERRELPSLHPRRIDCNCTKMNRAVPMSPGTPNRSGVCNFDFYTPANAKQTIKLASIRSAGWLSTSPAYHMIAATIFFNCDIAFWTFFRVGRNPIGRLWIVFTFLDPFLQKAAQHGIVPIFTAFETKHMRTFACHRPGFHINHLDGISTIDRWTPTQQPITFYETICD